MLIMLLCQLELALLPHFTVSRTRALQPGPCIEFHLLDGAVWLASEMCLNAEAFACC